MKNKITKKVFLLAVLAIVRNCHAQGFINLNFEAANIITAPGYSFYALESSAIPGWSASPINELNGNRYIGYNTVSTGGAAVILEESNNISPIPIQGRYSIFFTGDYVPGNPPGSDFGNSAEIAQTGLVPSLAQSLVFWGNLAGVDVVFNSQIVPYTTIGSGNGYNIYGADISAYSGQVGKLEFIAHVNGGGTLDNIQFSASPVPEPGTVGLFAMGGLFFAWRRWKKSGECA